MGGAYCWSTVRELLAAAVGLFVGFASGRLPPEGVANTEFNFCFV